VVSQFLVKFHKTNPSKGYQEMVNLFSMFSYKVHSHWKFTGRFECQCLLRSFVIRAKVSTNILISF